MTTEQPDDTTRTIDLSIEVAGTPDEVWAAIATGAGVTAWMHPTTIEERTGGHYAYDMQRGDGWNDTGTVAASDPPRRFAAAGVSWVPQGDAEPALLATEWIVETEDGGTCSVRMVMSDFGAGDV